MSWIAYCHHPVKVQKFSEPRAMSLNNTCHVLSYFYIRPHLHGSMPALAAQRANDGCQFVGGGGAPWLCAVQGPKTTPKAHCRYTR